MLKIILNDIEGREIGETQSQIDRQTDREKRHLLE